MTYTIIPNSGQSLGVTRVPINTNFSLIQSVFAENHIGFNFTGAGKHKFVVMPNQTVAPATLAGEAALYSKQGVAGPGTSEIYMIRDNNAGTEVALTSSRIGAPILTTNGGVNWLPGQMFIQWGFVLGTHGGNNHFNQGDTTPAVVFTLPFTTNCFGVFTQPVFTLGSPPSGGAEVAVNYTNTGFTWAFNTDSDKYTSFNWYAIGV